MLAGPDLLVVLAIAFIVVGPKRFPELAKTIGKAMTEFRKATDEIKESSGIKDLQAIRGNLSGMDLFIDLADKVSNSMASSQKLTKETLTAEDPASRSIPPPREEIPSVAEEEKPKENKMES